MGAVWCPADLVESLINIYLLRWQRAGVVSVSGDNSDLNAIYPAAYCSFLVRFPCVCRTGLKILVGANSFLCCFIWSIFWFLVFVFLKNCKHHFKKMPQSHVQIETPGAWLVLTTAIPSASWVRAPLEV